MVAYTFLCPNGTIFNQDYFICDWWFNVDCQQAEALSLQRNDDLLRARAEADARLEAERLAAASVRVETVAAAPPRAYGAPVAAPAEVVEVRAVSNGYASPVLLDSAASAPVVADVRLDAPAKQPVSGYRAALNEAL